MAVSYIFTPSTIIASAEVNQNFDDVDYSEIANNKAVQWYNTGAALSAYIKQNNSDDLLINNPDGDLIVTADTINLTNAPVVAAPLNLISAPMLVDATTNTILYGGTNQSGAPNGDGFRIRYEAAYGGGSADYLVIEKTDGNQTSPDGGIIFVLTGNDGVVEESIEIEGDGDVAIHDQNRLYLYNSSDTASSYFEQATNFSLVSSASAGYFDIDFSAGSGAVRLKSSTDLYFYDATNTNYTQILYGSNFEIRPSSGSVHIYDGSHVVHLRIYSTAGGSEYGDIYHDGTFHINTGAGDIYIDPAGGDVYFRSGVDIRQYNNANTIYGQMAMGSNWDFVSSSGEITMNPFSSFRVTAGTNIVFTPGASGDVYVTGGAYLYLRDPSDTATAAFYVAATSYDLYISTNSTSGGGLWRIDTPGIETSNSTYLGSSGAPFSWIYGTYGYHQLLSTYGANGVMSFGVAATGGFDFSYSANGRYIKAPNSNGAPASVANGMMWYDTSVNLFKVRENGVTRTM